MSTTPDGGYSHRSVAYALVEPLIDGDNPLRVTADEHDDGTEDDIQIVFENDLYEPETGVPYVVLEWIPGEKTSSMDAGFVSEEGAMRIMCYSELGIGNTYLNALADEVESKFPYGATLTRGEWSISILSVTRSMAERLTEWRRIIVDVSYQAWRV